MCLQNHCILAQMHRLFWDQLFQYAMKFISWLDGSNGFHTMLVNSRHYTHQNIYWYFSCFSVKKNNKKTQKRRFALKLLGRCSLMLSTLFSWWNKKIIFIQMPFLPRAVKIYFPSSFLWWTNCYNRNRRGFYTVSALNIGTPKLHNPGPAEPGYTLPLQTV